MHNTRQSHSLKRQIKKKSRRIPVNGEPIEEYQHERLLKCWYCGDINTTGRDEEDNGKSTMSSNYSLPRVRSLGAREPNSKVSILSINKSIFATKTSPKLGSNGIAKPVKNAFTVSSHRGCKSCGTINWSGKF